MLHLFRKIFQSKFGIVLTLGFLALIALAFASSDIVSNNPTFGGVAGGDQVAVAGDRKISAAEFRQAMTNELESRRQQQPTLTMQALIASGASERVADQLLQRAALVEWGRKYGIRAGKRLVDSELVKIPAFFGANGQFDQDTFKAIVAREGLTEAQVRQDIASGLIGQQILVPASHGAVVPVSLARQYALLLRERRTGAIAQLPSELYAPKDGPTDAQLSAYFKDHGDDYIRPERRVVRYATFGEEVLGTLPAPTAAQVKARYEQNKAQYAAKEERTFTQMVVPTEAAANAIVNELASGKTMAVSAREKGLSTTTVGPVSKTVFATQASQAVADAGFAAAEGGLVKPARGNLGWYVLKVEKITRQAGRTLADATPELTKSLADEQRRQAFVDMASRIEDEFDDGNSIEDVARELKITLKDTAPLTADGRVYGKPEAAPPELASALKTAFEMQEGEPQIAEIVPGQTFLVFGVSDITASAVAPLAEIRDDVTGDWRRSEGAKAAKAAADRIMKAVDGGKTLAEAVAAEKVALPRPEAISMGREELARAGQVPPVLALFFSMAQGTTKRLEGPRDQGWFVAHLDSITLPEVQGDDPLIGQTRQQLASVFGDEYAEQFVRAAMADVGTEKNQAAIDATLRQLTGQAE
ncbi:peptidylprolyl isomerase [Altererythrobacter salegens]|uniref:Parvulin-like PPIase n=1 Tax=Croceibacterium salegens TaxID=1737568 RepID=A0A6I4SVP6_9SPHN|nr:peptidylprolyl isomerase [Croceibacterium salegens]MXO59608.1 peptidylprolyl isomerase [Croceibacterium salegens]